MFLQAGNGLYIKPRTHTTLPFFFPKKTECHAPTAATTNKQDKQTRNLNVNTNNSLIASNVATLYNTCYIFHRENEVKIS